MSIGVDDIGHAGYLAGFLREVRNQIVSYDNHYGPDLPSTPFCSLRKEVQHIISELNRAIEAAERFPGHPQGDQHDP